MNSFERIGSSQLLAFEGQRQIAAALGKALNRLLLRAMDMLGRNLPDGNRGPW